MGIAPNIASFVGAGTVREMVLGDAAADPNPAQLDAMRGVVRRAMDEGAMGVASALIYPPGTFAGTPELVAIAGAAEIGRAHVELQSLMRISYAVFCLQKKTTNTKDN